MIDAAVATVETRDYAPFGKTIKATGLFDLKHRFTSQPYDDLVELYNYGTRMYEPRWGRFVSADEFVERFDSGGLNSYAYVRNQPITGSHRAGQKASEETWR